VRRKNGFADDPTSRQALGAEGRDALHSVLDTLPEHEAAVIALRFGVSGGRPRSLQDIANHFNVSRETIRRIQRDVLEKIRLTPETAKALCVWDGSSYDGWEWWCRRLGDFVDTPAREHSMAAIERAWCFHCHKIRFIVRDGASKGGRPREYCSARCRQAAYRARKRIVNTLDS
jgi:hypothetical protein